MVNAKDLVGDIFGWMGSVISVVFFIAPVVPYYNLIKEKITYKETPGILLICSYINCVLWVVYGIKLSKLQVYTTNSIGGVVTLVWICIFLVFFVKKHVLKSIGFISLVVVVSVGVFLLFYYVVDPKKDEAKITGYVVMVFNILMYASPGEKIYTVIKTKNYNLIPIYSTIAAFVGCICWLTYGICGSDLSVIVPNSLGLFFGILQIIVYLIIRFKYNKNSEIKKEDNITEKKDDKISAEENIKNNVPDSNKKLEVEGEKNAEARIESERITVKKS